MKDFDGGSSEKAESGDYIAVFSFDPSSGKLQPADTRAKHALHLGTSKVLLDMSGENVDVVAYDLLTGLSAAQVALRGTIRCFMSWNRTWLRGSSKRMNQGSSCGGRYLNSRSPSHEVGAAVLSAELFRCLRLSVAGCFKGKGDCSGDRDMGIITTTSTNSQLKFRYYFSFLLFSHSYTNCEFYRSKFPHYLIAVQNNGTQIAGCHAFETLSGTYGALHHV